MFIGHQETSYTGVKWAQQNQINANKSLPLQQELYPDSSFLEVPTIPTNEADTILKSWLLEFIPIMLNEHWESQPIPGMNVMLLSE